MASTENSSLVVSIGLRYSRIASPGAARDPMLKTFLTCAVVAVALAVLWPRAVATTTGGPDVATFHNDATRSGHNPAEVVLTPATVSASGFGKVAFFGVDGKVDAQPLYMSAVSIPGQGTRNVLYVATEHNSVYALDATTGTVLWHDSLLESGETPSDTRSCSQVTPEIGITSTPVIDRTRGPNGVIYIVAMSKNGSGAYFQRLHALDITTGAELFGGPVNVQASFPKAGGTTVFDPKQYKERSALLLINNTIVTSWASHCDISPYTGWIISYNASTLTQAAVLNVTPNGSDGALWNAGGGPAADGAGNFYVLLGNGTFDTTLTGGFPSFGDYGNGFLKISTATGLSVADYFETSDTVSQSGADTDLGSGGPVTLPDLLDGGGIVRHLAVGAGKDARIYVADGDAMGKFDPAGDHIYQEIRGALAGGVFSTPAYFNGTVFLGAVDDRIKAFPIVNALLSTSPSSQTARVFAYPGATPSISSNNGSGAILWAVENTTPAVLHAYDAANLTHELYNFESGGRRSGRVRRRQ